MPEGLRIPAAGLVGKDTKPRRPTNNRRASILTLGTLLVSFRGLTD